SLAQSGRPLLRRGDLRAQRRDDALLPRVLRLERLQLALERRDPGEPLGALGRDLLEATLRVRTALVGNRNLALALGDQARKLLEPRRCRIALPARLRR